MATMSDTAYAKSGDVHIAYQVVGDGPIDVVVVAGWLTHVEWLWEEPSFVRFVDQLLPWARVVLFDKRGTGLSDRVSNDELPTLDERMDDFSAVLDAVGSTSCVLLAIHEATPLACLFAATHPDRLRALVIVGGHARGSWADDYPWAPTAQQHARLMEAIETRWGQGIGVANFAPSFAGDARFKNRMARYEQLSASPGAAKTLATMFADTDVRPVVPSIRVPTLVLHRTGDRMMQIGGGRWIAEHLPGAVFVELPGDDHWVGVDPSQIISEVARFVTGESLEDVDDRVVATMMFTDIVDSTKQLSRLGDERWTDLLDAHHKVLREEITRFRGLEIDTAGDGFFAVFDGPARAVKCAAQAMVRLRSLGVAIRAGVHTGEISLRGKEATGVGVHTAARISAKAGDSEVLVSRTVVDLVAGAGITFETRGQHQLKGLAGSVELFAASI